MAVVLAGILGGIVGGLVVGCGLYLWTQPERRYRPVRRETPEPLTSLSHELWRLYVAIVSGSAVSLDRLREAREEVALATSDPCCKREDKEALFSMESLIKRAWWRAGEFKRVGLSVHPGQFLDLTKDMQALFASLQLAAGTERVRAQAGVRESLLDLGAARLRRLTERRS